jgi:hypothetical protein
MNLRTLLQLPALAVAILPICAPLALAQTASCQALLRDGTFDQFDSLTDEQLKWRMSQWFCESGSSSSSTAAGGSATDLASGLGYSGSYSSQDAWKRDFCAATYSGLDVARFNRSRVRQASQALINGFNQCVASQGPGTVLSYAPGTSPMEFVLKVWFNPVGPSITQTPVTWQNAVQAGCPASGLPSSLNVGQPVTVVCRRASRHGVTIAVNTPAVVAINNVVQVPTIPPPPDCSGSRTQAGLRQTVEAGACNRTVAISAYGHYRKGCNVSRVRGVLSASIAGNPSTQLCFKSDSNFENAYLRCDASISLRPLESASIVWDTSDNRCADPANLTMSTTTQ